MAETSMQDLAKRYHEKHEQELKERGTNSDTESSTLVHSTVPTDIVNKSDESSSTTNSNGTLVLSDDDIDDEEASQIVEEAEKSQESSSEIESVPMITKEEIASIMPDIDAKIRGPHAEMLLKSMKDYRNRLITEEGLTPEEANKAVRSRANREAKKANDKWLDDHPHTGVISIKKDKEGELGLTKEEHEKLVSTKVIELHLITDEDLKHTKVANIPTGGSKLDYIRTLSSIAAHSVAMISLGDLSTFRSATSAEIVRSGITSDAKTPMENVDRLASFIYDHFVSCHTFSKYNEQNAVVLSYQDFCDKFPFFEIPMAEYAIYQASSPRSLDIDLTCDRCNKSFKWNMVPDKMLSVNSFSVNERKEFDAINAHIGNSEWLKANSEKKMEATIMESPITKNRYVIQNPSISRAKRVMQAATNLGLYEAQEGTDESTLNSRIIACAMMLNSMYIYSEKDDAYIEFKTDEVEDILKALPSLSNEDFFLINRFTLNYYYAPTFSSGMIKCPNCGRDIEFTPNAETLLFLYAREEFKIQ